MDSESSVNGATDDTGLLRHTENLVFSPKHELGFEKHLFKNKQTKTPEIIAERIFYALAVKSHLRKGR